MPQYMTLATQAHKVVKRIGKDAHLLRISTTLNGTLVVHLFGHPGAACAQTILTQGLRCNLLRAKKVPGVRVYEALILRVFFAVNQ